MSEDRKPWKRRFLLLLNNATADKDLPKMWALFKRNNLATSELIKSASVKIKDRLQKSESEELDKLYEDASGNEARLLTRIKDCDHLSDDFWRLLFAEVRDTECHPISRDKTTLLSEGGQEKYMTMLDIEEKFSNENPDTLTACKRVPDQMIHDDLVAAHLNVTTLRDTLQKSYEQRLSGLRGSLAAENPKWSGVEVEKQAAAQAKKETKDLPDAKLLHHRLAMKAEDEVQKSILRAMSKFKIPVHVFRGVNTQDQVGKFLQSFDIQTSKLKGFRPGGDSKGHSLECEHDIVAMALLPSGLLVSFVQV